MLVVDDEPAICELIQDLLTDAGLESVGVQNDQSAYAALRTGPTFVALIVDVNLGTGTTGFDVARFARQIAPDLPVLYVTGAAREPSFRAFGVPASEFIAKPFTRAELLVALDRAVKARTA